MFKSALKSGVLLGVLSMALTILFYIISPVLLAKWWLGFMFLFVFIVLIIIFGQKYRKEETEGYLSYGKAFQYSFVVFAISGLFGILARILLFEVIDPDLVGVLTEQLIEQQVSIMQRFGASESMIDEQMPAIRQGIVDSMSTKGILISYLWAIIFYVIGSLITAAFIKKNEPEEQF